MKIFSRNVQKQLLWESWPEETCRLYEPDISDREYYTEEMLQDAKDYSDTAIMVVGRFSGESSDCTQLQYKKNKKTASCW